MTGWVLLVIALGAVWPLAVGVGGSLAYLTLRKNNQPLCLAGTTRRARLRYYAESFLPERMWTTPGGHR